MTKQISSHSKIATIGVLSDTHGLLRPQLSSVLGECSMIFHAGDVCHPDILDRLADIAPTQAVRGNNDWMWKNDLPACIETDVYGMRVYMVHDRADLPSMADQYDLVIFGHSHNYEETLTGNTLYLNPGSCGPVRFRKPVTLALLDIYDCADSATGDSRACATSETDDAQSIYVLHRCHKTIAVRMVTLESDSPSAKSGSQDDVLSDIRHLKEPKKLIRSIMKDTDRGISVSKIAKKYGISLSLAEKICRLYLTHPGVDADGIMTKMGL